MCTFLRSFGLAETQQEAVFPISALVSASGRGGNQALDQAPDPAGHPIPLRRIRRRQRSPERMRRIRIAASSRVAPAFCVHGGAVGVSPGMDCVTYPAGPVDVFRSLLDPLRQTWRSGTHPAPGTDELCRLPLPTGSWILLDRCQGDGTGRREGGREGGASRGRQIPETVPVRAGVRSDAGDSYAGSSDFQRKVETPQNSFSSNQILFVKTLFVHNVQFRGEFRVKQHQSEINKKYAIGRANKVQEKSFFFYSHRLV